jgi:hypothetical protein
LAPRQLPATPRLSHPVVFAISDIPFLGGARSASGQARRQHRLAFLLQ